MLECFSVAIADSGRAGSIGRACRTCGGSAAKPGRRGPIPSYCSARCRPRKSIDRTCVVCAAGFVTENRTTTTCSRRCGVRLAQRSCHATRSANSAARRTRKCERCGIDFIEGSRSSKQIAAGAAQRFCSRSCARPQPKYASKREAKHAERVRRALREGRDPPTLAPMDRRCRHCEQDFQAATGRLFCSDVCRKADAAARTRDASEKAHAATVKLRECQNCGVTFTPVYGAKIRIFCSKRCCKIRSRRVSKAMRRARERATEVRPVDPFEVFRRDGWRCHLCEVATPRSLRGTTSPWAPELDHVIPLSRGGAHTYENTACACRACNIAKGDRLPDELQRVAA